MTIDTDPRLDWSLEGEPRSGRFGDVYFSKDDGLAESRAVFLAGCGLPDAWAGRRRFVVGELGFGTGLNIAALLTLWRDSRPAGARLNVFSIEAYPLSRDEARRALTAWPEIAPAAEALLAAWPESTPGLHRLDLPQFDAVLDLFIGEVETALSQWTGRADAWFLDGFSPALNPAMWSEAVMDGVAVRSAAGARLSTFTVAGHVRRALAARGFEVEKRPGHGRKRERLEARLPGAASAAATPSALVLGAGVAGAAVARALGVEGVAVTVVEDRASDLASGFPLALATPRLDAGDAVLAALYAAALERARRLYLDLPDAVAVEGVVQMEAADRDAKRYDRIAQQAVWPAGAMNRLESADVASRLQEADLPGALLMSGALAVRPSVIRQSWLESTARITAHIARVERRGDLWALIDAGGEAIAAADHLVLAGGWGVQGLWSEAPLSPVRGQADWVATDVAPFAAAWGGYGVSDGRLMLLGATHDRGETDTTVRAKDSVRNLAALQARMPGKADRVSAAEPSARAAVRATTPDRLPLCGEIEAGLHVLGGLGSRGFCVAPLLAEHIAARIVGAPSPLAADQAARLDPLRFLRRRLAQPDGVQEA